MFNLCDNCKGKGTYTVFNAYNPDDRDDVICEKCDGQGYIEYSHNPKRKSKRDVDGDDWSN